MDKYKIVVSEPWDFEGSAGANVIIGEIVKVLSPTCILFKSDHSLSFDGYTGRVLVLKPRYEKQVLSQKNNYEGTVGGGILMIEDYGGKDEKFLEVNSKYVLLGSLEVM